jgi:hypothetical protein
MGAWIVAQLEKIPAHGTLAELETNLTHASAFLRHHPIPLAISVCGFRDNRRPFGIPRNVDYVPEFVRTAMLKQGVKEIRSRLGADGKRLPNRWGGCWGYSDQVCIWGAHRFDNIDEGCRANSGVEVVKFGEGASRTISSSPHGSSTRVAAIAYAYRLLAENQGTLSGGILESQVPPEDLVAFVVHMLDPRSRAMAERSIGRKTAHEKNICLILAKRAQAVSSLSENPNLAAAVSGIPPAGQFSFVCIVANDVTVGFATVRPRHLSVARWLASEQADI